MGQPCAASTCLIAPLSAKNVSLCCISTAIWALPLNSRIQRSLAKSLGPDQEAVWGSLDDLGNGCDPGVPGAGGDGDGEAIEVCGEGAGVALEASSPDAALDLGRGPSRDRVRGLGLDRGEGLLGSGGSGTELAIEGLVDEGAQPGADVEVTLGAEALEALTGIGRDCGYKVEHPAT